MPIITIYTSSVCEQPEAILAEVTALLANQLGKPESVTMARLESEVCMSMGGSTSEHSALFEVEGIDLAAENALPLTEQLCRFAEGRLKTKPDRVFVKLNCVPRGLWGGNGKVY